MGKAQQTLTGVAASFAAILMGSLNVWPSYTLEHYTDPNSTVLSEPMTAFQASLVGSLPSLGGMLGTAITGVTINTFGRRLGAMMLVFPAVFHWATIALTSSTLPILVARFVGGITGGANVVYAPVYVSETAEPSIRGTLAAVALTCYFLGTTISYISGWLLSYGAVIWVNLGFCAVNLILLLLVKESPLYLLRQNREQAALKALAAYRDGSTTSKSVLEELSVIKQQLLTPVEMDSVRSGADVEEGEKEKLNTDEREVVVAPPNVPAWKLLFEDRSSRRAFFTLLIVANLQVMMGSMAVQVYAGKIFSEAAPEHSANFCSVLVALSSFSGCAIAMAITDKAGRRVLIISSSVLVAFCMSGFGLQLQLGTPPLLAAGTILLFCMIFNYGAGAVPYVLMAEIFSPEVQNIGSMIVMECVWFSNFLLIAVFPLVISLVGMHGACYAFACVALVNASFAFLRIPETKGLTNLDIQALFAK